MRSYHHHHHASWSYMLSFKTDYRPSQHKHMCAHGSG